jgi:hypothetical protein
MDGKVEKSWSLSRRFFEVALAPGQTGYQFFAGSQLYGQLLQPAARCEIVRMEPAAWLRLDRVRTGLAPELPAYSISFRANQATSKESSIRRRIALLVYVSADEQ